MKKATELINEHLNTLPRGSYLRELNGAFQKVIHYSQTPYSEQEMYLKSLVEAGAYIISEISRLENIKKNEK